MEEQNFVLIGIIVACGIYLLYLWSRGEMHQKIERGEELVEEEVESTESTLLFPNESMTKAEIEEAARSLGIALDRRKTKAHMLIDFEQEYARLTGKDLP